MLGNAFIMSKIFNVIGLNDYIHSLFM